MFVGIFAIKKYPVVSFLVGFHLVIFGKGFVNTENLIMIGRTVVYTTAMTSGQS